jgi:hypothetical protein
MVAFALVAMCGILGLAVDLGWAYFVRSQAQKAADAGALAAVEQFLASNGVAISYLACPTGACQTNYSCAAGNSVPPPGNNLDSGCIYIASKVGSTWYGFVDSKTVGISTQMAKLDSGITDPVTGKSGYLTVYNSDPSNPGSVLIKAPYWVTARVGTTIPQLFSAVLGNTMASVASRATASVEEVPTAFDVWALNRQLDTIPTGPDKPQKINPGENFYGHGDGQLITDGSVSFASNAIPTAQALKEVTAPTVYQTGGSVSGFTSATPHADYSGFVDPMAGKPSPLAPSGLQLCPVLNGVIPSNAVLAPGIYYPATTNNYLTGGIYTTGKKTAAAAPMTWGSNVKFTSGGSCRNSDGTTNLNGGSSGTGNFGGYIIYGGLDASNGANFEAGRYVLAGVPWDSSGTAQAVLTLGDTTDHNAQSLSASSVKNTDGGEVFILTDPYYEYGSSGLPLPSGSILASDPHLGDYHFGYVYEKAGASTGGALHGVDPTNSTVPSDLTLYGSLLLWQDRRNSTVQYNTETPGSPHPATDGHIACGDNSNTGCFNPNMAALGNNQGSAVIAFGAEPSFYPFGIVYQPRGSLFSLHNGDFQGYMQLITGAIELEGNGNIHSLGNPSNPLTRIIPVLVQ